MLVEQGHDFGLDKDFKKYIEAIIKDAKMRRPHVINIMSLSRLKHKPSVIEKINAIDVMLRLKLIELRPEGENNYNLTEKGIYFTSFRNEKIKHWIKNHAVTYLIAQIIFTSLLTLLTGYALWRMDNKVKNQEIIETKTVLDRVNRRLDSLINLPLFNQHPKDSNILHK